MAKKISELLEFFNVCEIADKQLNTPVLYSKSKSGKIGTWQGHLLNTPDSTDFAAISEYTRLPIVFESKANGVFFTTYVLTEGGKLNISAPTLITAGSNVSRANETTPFQQALSKLMTKFNDKQKEGAVVDKNELIHEISFAAITNRKQANPNRINVMALHDVSDNWKKVSYPCYVQPKLDGIHMVANCYGELDLFSRGMTKKISQNHIREALHFLCEPEWKGFYITGEMWSPNVNRQGIASIVGQEEDSNITTRLPLYVFDVFTVDKQLSFIERFKLAIKAVKQAKSPYIKLVDIKKVNNREELETYYKKQLEAGMEGIVIRDPHAFYEFGIEKEKRSYGVMKYKPRFDSEFLIVGFKSGSGKFKETIVFIAETAEKKKFSVAPAWPMEERKKAFLEGDTYIGRYATISYDSISNDGKPVQPVLIAFV